MDEVLPEDDSTIITAARRAFSFTSLFGGRLSAGAVGDLQLLGRLRMFMGGRSSAWPPDDRYASSRVIDSSGFSTWAL